MAATILRAPPIAVFPNSQESPLEMKVATMDITQPIDSNTVRTRAVSFLCEGATMQPAITKKHPAKNPEITEFTISSK